MGRLNRQRRAEKRRQRAHLSNRRDTPGPRARPRDARDAVDVDRLVAAAASAQLRDQADLAAVSLRALHRVDALPGGRDLVARALASRLEQTISLLWDNGWQPAELAHVARRQLGASAAALLVAGIGGEARAYASSPIEPRWQAQLDELGVVRADTEKRYLAAAGRSAGLGPQTMVERAVALLAFLYSLPRLAELAPPPRQWGRKASRPRERAATAAPVDERVLGRVRALLAKAESTEFPDEADALTAKAQELMARHSIDHAMLDEGPSSAEPETRRVIIDDPYAEGKSYLLAVVARANRAEAVWMDRFAMSAIVGFPADLDGTELLFTSLLVQGTTAMRVLGRDAPPGARTRRTSFRRSFYVGFASRIGERLKAATEAAVDEARSEHGDRLLPVLASRRSAVDDTMARLFPSTTTSSVGGTDGAGLLAGRIAADQARLSSMLADELEASA